MCRLSAIGRIEQYQKEIVYMFSRIMQAVQANNNATNENILSDPDFNIKDFPCSNLQQLLRLNQLCLRKHSVKKILVIYWFFISFSFSSVIFMFYFFRNFSGNETSLEQF